MQLERDGERKEICTQQTSACTWRAKTASLYVRDTSELVFLVSQELFLKRKYISHFVISPFMTRECREECRNNNNTSIGCRKYIRGCSNGQAFAAALEHEELLS